jgi:serine/threonine protein kinase
LHKAIKFVPGVRAACAGALAGELEAIQRVRSIRHPFLLSMERVEFVGDDLVIVTELADRDLQDLYDSFRQAGQPGIPRDQLLNYLREAAETLDLVNTQYGLQHLDIKPSNLFLVSRHIKIGDFGLAVSLFGKELSAGESARSATAYTSPEVLEGGSTRQSDQYSLAVLYQEMRTGTLPFRGSSSEQLGQAPLGGRPDLESLPVADRTVVARALARDPNLRFGSCSEFIKALVFGHVEVTVVPSSAGKPSRQQAEPAQAIPAVVAPTVDRATAEDALAGKPSRPEPELVQAVPPAVTLSEDSVTAEDTETGKPSSPESEPAQAVPDAVAPSEDSVTSEDAAEEDAEPVTYQFVRCLYRTALTESWDVNASDGRKRVAKILFGPAGGNSEALNRLLSLCHPVLAPLEFGEHTPGRLVLVSDPIKASLRDWFQECRTKGLPGVPRDQLVGYLKTVAAALTELYCKEDVQHLGLHPRNLFLSGDQAYIADFGIAQLLWLPVGEAVSRMNPRYSAPELVQRKLSPACDQYSLALIYHELLTGRLPQAAGTSQPIPWSDLQSLPEAERTPIARALDRDPEKRWPSCAELISALESPYPKAVPVESALPVASLPAALPFEERAAPVVDAPPAVNEAIPPGFSEAADAPAPLSDEGLDGPPTTLAESFGGRDTLVPTEEGATRVSSPQVHYAAPAPASMPELDLAAAGSAALAEAEKEDETATLSEDASAPPAGVSGFASGLFQRSPSIVDQPSPAQKTPSVQRQPAPEPEPTPSAPEPLDGAGVSAEPILETRFGVNLSATTVRHRLDGVRRQWNGRELRRDDENLIFLMKPPRSYWQRWATNPVTLEVHIHLQEAPPLVPAPTEVSVAVLPTDETEATDEPMAKALGQILLESIRAALQVDANGRGQERLPWPHPLKLWPVHAGGRHGEPIDCQGKDLSLNGIGFYVPGEPPPKVIRLQLPKTDQTPAMTVPARVVRVQASGDGWHEVGAILLMR